MAELSVDVVDLGELVEESLADEESLVDEDELALAAPSALDSVDDLRA